MGKMIYLMGKSSSGKDTVYKRLIEDPDLSLKRVIPYTTRPIREGERDGKEYFFTTESGYHRLMGEGRVIEDRAYQTYHGLWRYFTVDDGSVDFSKGNYLAIGTPEAYKKVAAYYGEENMLPIMLTVDDGLRLKRALEREMEQTEPKYQELCRRFLADEEDFSEEKLKEAGITNQVSNENLEGCIREIIRLLRAGEKS